MSDHTWLTPAAAVALAGVTAWLLVGATIPALRERASAENKNSALEWRQRQIQAEIVKLKAEAAALRGDYQYNRRVERWLFRGAPEPGD
jgi:hypothetical protein